MSKIEKADLLQLIQEQADMIVELSGMVKMNKLSIIKLENEREQDSLIERDKVELTGSDYYYSKSATERLENGQKLVMCFVSNVSESDAMDEGRIEVITSVDTEFNDTDGYGWQYAIPINNQGEPLTAAEAGL